MSECWKAETAYIPNSFGPRKSPSPGKLNESSGVEVSNYNVAMLKYINQSEILVITGLLQLKERLLRKNRFQKKVTSHSYRYYTWVTEVQEGITVFI